MKGLFFALVLGICFGSSAKMQRGEMLECVPEVAAGRAAVAIGEKER